MATPFSGKRTIVPTNGAGKTKHSHLKEQQLESFLAPCTKINSELMEDLNVRTKTKTIKVF